MERSHEWLDRYTLHGNRLTVGMRALIFQRGIDKGAHHRLARTERYLVPKLETNSARRWASRHWRRLNTIASSTLNAVIVAAIPKARANTTGVATQGARRSWR